MILPAHLVQLTLKYYDSMSVNELFIFKLSQMRRLDFSFDTFSIHKMADQDLLPRFASADCASKAEYLTITSVIIYRYYHNSFQKQKKQIRLGLDRMLYSNNININDSCDLRFRVRRDMGTYGQKPNSSAVCLRMLENAQIGNLFGRQFQVLINICFAHGLRYNYDVSSSRNPNVFFYIHVYTV